MLRGLVKLIRHMDGLTGPADPEVIRQFLSEADVERNDMIEACKFNDVTYARNRLAKSRWYELLVICWRHGQQSPIHDHCQSACGVRVVDGIATETIYQRISPGVVKPIARRCYDPGSVIVSRDSEIHLITNDEPDRELITLHLYSPPLSMTYYEIESAMSQNVSG